MVCEGMRVARVLLVEDESIVAMMAESMIADAGHTVIGPAATLSEALGLLTDNSIDVAILDVNLGDGQRVYPVADRLLAAGIPFCFVTGYGVNGIDPKYVGICVLDKPYQGHAMKSIIEEMVLDKGIPLL
jgi:CheY-like chemotaxis protein